MNLLKMYLFFHKFIHIAVNWNIEKEVAQYERKYRGRELPGFINYKTFEGMIQQHIKQLEEPAVQKLKQVSGMSYHDVTIKGQHFHTVFM